MKKLTAISKIKKPKKSANVPATAAMLYRVRDGLSHKITSVKLDMKSLERKMDARFKEVDARFKEVDARFDKVDARFKEVDARFDKMDSRFDELSSKINQVLEKIQDVHLKVDAQEARNLWVMDRYNGLHDRISKLEGT